MAPRTRKQSAPTPAPLAEVVAFSVRMFREGERLTQAELAEKMNSIGFATWSRTTVTEIEGKGRGRNINFAELIGLASILRVSVADLLAGGGQTWGGPIELAPGGLTIGSVVDLVALILPVDLVKDLAGDVARAAMELERERMGNGISEAMYRLASWLRDTAGKFEQTADELTAQSEEAS